MKTYERIGSGFAATSFSLIAFHLPVMGFSFGVVSTILLAKYFKNTRQISLFLLQLFFLINNVVGIYFYG